MTEGCFCEIGSTEGSFRLMTSDWMDLPTHFLIFEIKFIECNLMSFVFLFQTPNVNKDPYKLIEYLRASVERRKNEQYNLPDLNFS